MTMLGPSSLKESIPKSSSRRSPNGLETQNMYILGKKEKKFIPFTPDTVDSMGYIGLLLVFLGLFVVVSRCKSKVSTSRGDKRSLSGLNAVAWSLRMPKHADFESEPGTGALRVVKRDLNAVKWSKVRSWPVIVPDELILSTSRQDKGNYQEMSARRCLTTTEPILRDIIDALFERKDGVIESGRLTYDRIDGPSDEFQYSACFDSTSRTVRVSVSADRWGFDTVTFSVVPTLDANDRDGDRDKAGANAMAPPLLTLALAEADAAHDARIVMPVRLSVKKCSDSKCVTMVLSVGKDLSLPPGVVLKVISVFEHVLGQYVPAQLQLLSARRRQQQLHRERAVQVQKERRLKRLDKTKNPEKYRAVRPGSLNAHKGVDSGRYRPSKDAQARRSVKTFSK